MIEAVSRLLPGVVGNAESLVEESHEDGLLEYPVYTRPARWEDGEVVREVPPVLLSGDHGAIAAVAPRAAPGPYRGPPTRPPRDGRGDRRPRRPRRARRDGLPTPRSCDVLQLACWVPEARISGSWTIPPLDESAEDVARGLEEWTTWVARVRTDGGAPGRLVASVRGRVRPGDPTVWETGRLMVAPDLQGRGLGRDLLALAEAGAPPTRRDVLDQHLAASPANQRRYKRAGYRAAARRGQLPGHGRPHQAPPLTPDART